MSGDAPEILLEERGAVGLVTLNRPRALNALTLNMIRLLTARLAEWASSEAIGAVVIRGAGDRAFCAGGDVRELYDRRGTDFGAVYYAEEYRLNVAIHRFPKPWIALMDGLTMGGGAGVSVHGSHRIVTERTVFAMPETAIGLFPDVGATLFLNRCPGEIGLFLALTGYRMSAADALYAGIGDRCVPSGALDTLIEALADARHLDRPTIEAILDDMSEPPGEAPLRQHRAAIDRCFAGSSVEEILDRLAREGSKWARLQIETIGRMSPTSLKVAFRQLREGAAVDRIEEAMLIEYRLACRFYRGHDFFEGTRALVIEKDGTPEWRPSTLDEVGGRDVDAYFRPVPGEPDFGRPGMDN